MNATASSCTDTGLQCEVERGSAGCARVAVRGELDLLTAPELRQTLGELIASGRTTITLDLTELSFIDSAGHRSIANVADLAEGVGGEVLLGGCSLPVRRFLDLTTRVLASAPRAWAGTCPDVDRTTERLPRAVGF
jgi:anti-anti-sigma factor